MVAAPDSVAPQPAPTQPRDRVDHARRVWHPAPGAPTDRWEFTEPLGGPAPDGEGRQSGRHVAGAVPARVLTTDPGRTRRLARARAGVPGVREDRVRDAVAQGELVVVLDACSAPFPGSDLHDPQRRLASPALRAPIDDVRRTPRPERR